MADAHDKKCTEGFHATPLTPVGAEGSIALAHRADHQHELGVVRPLKPGDKPMPGCKLLRLDEASGRYVEAPPQDGPAMVNSAAYRAGWGRIFGGRQEVGQA